MPPSLQSQHSSAPTAHMGEPKCEPTLAAPSIAVPTAPGATIAFWGGREISEADFEARCLDPADVVVDDVRSCAAFRTPPRREDASPAAPGVGNAPRHEARALGLGGASGSMGISRGPRVWRWRSRSRFDRLMGCREGRCGFGMAPTGGLDWPARWPGPRSGVVWRSRVQRRPDGGVHDKRHYGSAVWPGS